MPSEQGSSWSLGGGEIISVECLGSKLKDMNKEPQRTGRFPERWGGGGSRRKQMMKTREEFQESQDQKGFPRDNLGSILKMTI